jgi:hypothetical protein
MTIAIIIIIITIIIITIIIIIIRVTLFRTTRLTFNITQSINRARMKDWRGLTSPRFKCVSRVHTRPMGHTSILATMMRVKRKRRCTTRHMNLNLTQSHSNLISMSTYGHQLLISTQISISVKMQLKA